MSVEHTMCMWNILLFFFFYGNKTKYLKKTTTNYAQIKMSHSPIFQLHLLGIVVKVEEKNLLIKNDRTFLIFEFDSIIEIAQVLKLKEKFKKLSFIWIRNMFFRTMNSWKN